uniref:G_PROTEIN_RECEP_F1_2 domain-containing protein n=1 Tax=Globodera pallida TaxID=36090 RepID=A0A183BKD0_GLOPA
MQFDGVFPRDKLPLSFILTIGVRWFIGLLGFVLNFSLVYVTWKTKKFRQLCNSLIAANAFFSGLFGLSLSIGWAFILAGQPFMFEGHCVVLQAVPLLCRNLGLNLLFWLGFDRLISALFMNSFLHRHNSFYYLLITIGSASHAGYIVVTVIGMAIDYPDHINLCSTHDDTYVGPTALTLMLVNVILSAIIFLVELGGHTTPSLLSDGHNVCGGCRLYPQQFCERFVQLAGHKHHRNYQGLHIDGIVLFDGHCLCEQRAVADHVQHRISEGLFAYFWPIFGTIASEHGGHVWRSKSAADNQQQQQQNCTPPTEENNSQFGQSVANG